MTATHDDAIGTAYSTPQTADALHEWIRTHLHIQVPREPLVSGSTAPFDYIVHAFFEGTGGRKQTAAGELTDPEPPSHPADCAVWANRGGGKTFLGALATTLDLVFKPGIQVRILAGSLEQAQRMHAHLRRFFEDTSLAELLDGRITERCLKLHNGSTARVLAQSQTAVRGERVQKLRCDEADLLDPEIWTAAQLTTRSMSCLGPWGDIVRGSIEALSTMHRPFGVMWDIVHQAQDAGTPIRRLFRWGVVDALEHCDDKRSCEACPLGSECAGRAKLRVPERAGHIPIADALALKARVDALTWESEMLCLRPRRTDNVYPEFDPAVHVAPFVPDDALPLLAGMDFGIRSKCVVLLAQVDHAGVLRILAEHVRTGIALTAIIQHITQWRDLDGVPVPTLDWLGIDPAGHARNHQSGLRDTDVLKSAGLRARWRILRVQEGVRLVRARIAPADGSPPRLLVHPRCVQLIEALRRYHYDPNKLESLEPVKDGYDHACDALRYLVVCLDAAHLSLQTNYLQQ